MMYQKAVLFNDAKMAAQILEADHPRKVKSLGRLVENFDDKVWCENRARIVREGNIAKFSCPVTEEGFGLGTCDEPAAIVGSLKAHLLATGDREIVEASPLDRIWGVGFGPRNAEKSRERWGLNLLGKALMGVRTIFREEEKS